MFGGKIRFFVLAYRLTGIVLPSTQIGSYDLTRVLYDLLIPTSILSLSDKRMAESLTT